MEPGMSGPVVREALLDDAPAVSRLLGQLGYPASPDEMRGRLQALINHPDYVTFVAEISGEVVGLVGAQIGYSLEVTGRYGRLTGLVVEERWRGKGIGGSLMARIEDWIRQQGSVIAVLASGPHYAEAHRFYRHLGYEETGIRFVKRLGSPVLP